MVGKSKIYILTSSGIKKEGEKFLDGFSTPECAWSAYAELFGNLILEKQKKNASKVTVTWINKPHVVSYEQEKYEMKALKKKERNSWVRICDYHREVFNIYSRFTITND